MDSTKVGENQQQQQQQQQQAGSPTTRRRSSNTLFQGLQDARRNPVPSARRQSLHDQKPEPGMIGRLWRSFTESSSESSQ